MSPAVPNARINGIWEWGRGGPCLGHSLHLEGGTSQRQRDGAGGTGPAWLRCPLSRNTAGQGKARMEHQAWTNHPNRGTLFGFASPPPSPTHPQGPRNTILVHPIDGGLTAPEGQQDITNPIWADLKALKLPLHFTPWCSAPSSLGESSSKPTVWQATL